MHTASRDDIDPVVLTARGSAFCPSQQVSHLPETSKTSRAHGLWLRFKGGEEREVQWKQGSECLAADACKSVLIWSCGFKEESRIFSLPASQNKIIRVRLQEAERNCTVIQTRPGKVCRSISIDQTPTSPHKTPSD